MRTIITFILVIGVLVFVHEFGHFFFARRAGILVREFAIGMGPKIYAHKGKDGTAYTLRLLPIGGYVRMAGMDEDFGELNPGTPATLELSAEGVVKRINTSSKVQLTHGIPLEIVRHDLVDALTITGFENGDESDTVTYPVAHDATIIEGDGTEVRIAPRDVQFQSAKLWERLLTNFAGPMNNFILAIILFIAMTFMQGGVANYDSTQLGSVVEDGIAAKAGLKAGDEIQTVAGKKVASWTEFVTLIQENPGKEVTVAYERDGAQKSVTLTPEAKESNGQQVGYLGVMVSMKTGFMDKVAGGLQMAASMSIQLFKAFGSLLTSFSLDKLGGPVMMYQLSSEAASQGLTTVIWLMAVLSVNLGMVNLFPIPALDGGKIVLNLIEGVRGKPLKPEKEGILTMIGFGMMMVLMILVTWNDIQRFFFK